MPRMGAATARRFGTPSSLARAVSVTGSPTVALRREPPTTSSVGRRFPKMLKAPPAGPPAPLLFMIAMSFRK